MRFRLFYVLSQRNMYHSRKRQRKNTVTLMEERSSKYELLKMTNFLVF